VPLSNRAKVKNMRVYKPNRKDRNGRSIPYSVWYLEFRDHQETMRRTPAFKDKKASEELGRKIERLVSRRVAGESPDTSMSRWLETLPGKLIERLAKIGVLEPRWFAASKPLPEHLKDFERYLDSKGNTKRHIQQTVSEVNRVFKLCGFRFWSDIAAGKVQQCLADLRNGKNTISLRTSNHHLRAVKHFCKWMVKEQRASASPIDHLGKLNEKTDSRRKRRALTHDELKALLKAARKGPVVHGMTGKDREMLYRVDVETGLRWSELRSLKVSSFSLETEPPTVRVDAAYSKHRQEDVLPLRAETAILIREYLSKLFPENPAFPMRKGRGAEMMRHDLEAAEIEYVDEGGRYADFHSLRHSYITALAKSGVHPKTAQSLARHSTISLTMDHYTHTVLEDQSEALKKLPDLSAPDDEQKQKATGTAGAEPSKSVAFCVPFQGGFDGIERDKSGQVGGRKGNKDQKQEVPQKAEDRQSNAFCDTSRSIKTGAPGEIRTPDFRIRNPVLYPAELRARIVLHGIMSTAFVKERRTVIY